MAIIMQESVIKDIFDAIADVKDAAEKGFIGTADSKSLTASSISRASRNLTMTFPVLCDSSIDPKTAMIISKAVERKAIGMLQMLFSAYSFTHVDDITSVLNKWHSNIDGRLDINDYVDYLNQLDTVVTKMRESSTSFAKNYDRTISFQEKVVSENFREYKPKVYEDNFSEHSLNEYLIVARYGENVVLEDKSDTVVGTSPKMADSFRQQIFSNDVKKCNELTPSYMIINFFDSANNPKSFVGAVKARLIPIDSSDIAERIRSKNSDKKGLVNFIRATTSEIGFVKDYLLGIEKAKIEALQNSMLKGKSNRIWKTLEKRATRSIFKRLMSNTNDAAAITTLVISQQLVNSLLKEYRIDMTNVNTAAAFMDAYNLLAICIVDDITEVAYFLFDGEEYYEQLSFDALERDSGDNNSNKKIINLLSGVRR